jgi:hypothetical protein
VVEGLFASGLLPPDTSIVEHVDSGNLRPLKAVKRPRDTSQLQKRGLPIVKVKDRDLSGRRKKRPATELGDFDLKDTVHNNSTPSFSIPSSTVPATQSSTGDRHTGTPAARLPLECPMFGKRRFSAKAEGAALTKEYHDNCNSINLDRIQNPHERAKAALRLIDFNFMAWNRAIVDVKAYSEQLALLLLDFRNFFKSQVETYPKMLKR